MAWSEVVGVYYAGMSVATLCAYAWDKRVAQKPGARRLRERTLHLWALAGGFAGAWLGQAWLRHKTRHLSFAGFTLLAAGLHVGGWIWWWNSR